jgi:hypothetical protein
VSVDLTLSDRLLVKKDKQRDRMLMTSGRA